MAPASKMIIFENKRIGLCLLPIRSQVLNEKYVFSSIHKVLRGDAGISVKTF
jgi:hypothetical protein